MPPILLVEDNEDLREAYAELLRSEGYSVLEAGTAKRAHAVLEALAEPALVLLDLGLPKEGGEAILSTLALPEAPSEAAHRVILITASPAPRVEAARGSAAVVAVLAKPSSVDDILDVIRGQFASWPAPEGTA